MRISLSRRRSTSGFTFIELLVSLTLLASVSLYLFQAFISGMTHAGRANEQVAATIMITPANLAGARPVWREATP